VATTVKRAVAYGLPHRARRPSHAIGIDEVSRRKRPSLPYSGLLSGATGKRRCQTPRVVCMDMWARYAKLVASKP
jgi:hypothetical protein